MAQKKSPKTSKKEFAINFRMVCNGTVIVTAASEEEAEQMVQDMSPEALGAQSSDTDVEIV